MLKKIVFILATVMVMSLSVSAAYSAEGAYVSGFGGVAMTSDTDVTDTTAPGVVIVIEYETGMIFTGAAGYDFGNFRVEGEFGFTKNDFSKATVIGLSADMTGDITTLTYMANGYVDFTNDTQFTPYVSAGIGAATIDVNDLNIPGSGVPSVSTDDTVFAYQLGAGVEYAVNDKFSFDLKYRFLGIADPSFGTTEAEYSSHNILFGIRIKF